ncbi:MerR family transcriptional regulator [Amycolatopsis azurea]|uniref:DNA-binding protein n=1 Tax=Amycolatopsis azurea DSM 43854 TaxID=1238180 RepID=M2PTP6_9PSEU|nr:helix-turn-helix domain-containing protein [Amycolatopsis azurea]EMD22890.1 hypothetical protein C791_7890 [Amycolatopsis azurea DSM 43854]OOC04257.1 DNA-binding protein [Amycolatopsis azurea DSM 43854]
MTGSPWMTLQETAAYLRMHVRTIQKKALEYDRSNGKSGLKNMQPSGPDGKRLVHIDDANRWMDKQPPSRGIRRFSVAS